MIDREAFGIESPGFADELVGGEALERLESEMADTLLEISATAHHLKFRGAKWSSQDRERFQVNNVEQLQGYAQEQNEAAMASTNTLMGSVKTIATAHAEYSKKAFQDGSEFISKLTSLKSPDEAMKLQADYARSAYETFVAESKKISELYTDFFKQTFKPFENVIAKTTAAK
jgi:hypothetical protein